MTRAFVAAAVLVLAACGGSSKPTVYRADTVEKAFRESGIPLQRAPSSGAEQPAMGVVSGCPTRLFAADGKGVVDVLVCDDERKAGQPHGVSAMRGPNITYVTRTRRNVFVFYAGADRRKARQIDRALALLAQ